MLLTDKNTVVLTIVDKPIEVAINFKTLENIYHFIRDNELMHNLGIEATNPFDLISKIGDDISYMVVLLYCISDASVDISTIKLSLKSLVEYDDLIKIIESLIISQLNNKSESNPNDKSDKSDKSDMELFEDYYNYFYVVATTIMKYSTKEFYSFTPAKLKEISRIYNEENKVPIIKAYIDILKSRTGSKRNDVRVIKDANEFFDLI